MTQRAMPPRPGLAALVQEKPFNNVNGSGKHNNWSIGTTCGGVNLLNVKQLAEKSAVLLHVTVVVSRSLVERSTSSSSR